MTIRIRQTGQLMTDSEFRVYAQSQGAHFGFELTEANIHLYGADPVFEGPQASGGTVYQYSQQDGVEQINGQWYTKYILGPVFTDNENGTAAENEAAYKAAKDAEQAERVRDDRTKRLADCDWTQLADSPVDKTVWATYRQELRDITKADGFPWTMVWPVKP
jgi:hypothetical protein